LVINIVIDVIVVINKFLKYLALIIWKMEWNEFIFTYNAVNNG